MANENKNLNNIINLLENINQQNIDDQGIIDLELETKIFLISISKQLKSEEEKELKEFEEFLKLSQKNKHISLIIIVLLEKNFFETSKNLIEKIFMDNHITCELLNNTISGFYKNNLHEKILLPTRNIMINLLFKLPDKLANLCQKVFINRTDYFLTIFLTFFTKENQFLCDEILDKIFKLKLVPIFITFLKKNNLEDEKLIDFKQLNQKIISSIYYDDFLENLFSSKAQNFEEWNNLYFFYKNISIDQNISEILKGDTIKYLRRNFNYLSFILLSENEALQCFYLKDIIDNLKLKLEELDSFTFYLVLFSIFFIIEKAKEKGVEKIFENIFKIQGGILEKLIDKNKIKIFLLFSEYLQKKISKILKEKSDSVKDDFYNEEVIEDSFSKEEKEILDFYKIRDDLIKDPTNCFNKLKAEYEINILKINPGLKLLKSKATSAAYTQENKTKLLSVKFKKKYGDYDEIKIKNNFLEFNINKEADDVFEIKGLPVSNRLRIKLDKKDDFEDLQALSKPLYLKDCFLGLNSGFPDRQKLSLESLPELISNRPFDLDFFLPQLADCLLKLNNNFDLENFDDLVECILVSITEFDPVKMTEIMCRRFFEEECGIKQKFQILNVVEKSCENISNYFVSNKKNPKSNKMHVILENVIFPLLNHLKIKNIDYLIVIEDFDYLLAKFLDCISKIIKFSENHPFIYKTLFESMELFKAIVNNKVIKIYNCIVLLNSLNFFASVFNKFLNVSFLEIYPEFMQNFKFILQFLNDILENVQSEEIKIEIVKNMNNMLIGLEKIKEKYSNNLSVGIKDIIII